MASLTAYDKSKDFTLAISFLTAFFVIQSSIVYLYNIVQRKKSSVLEIIHLTANGLIYAFSSYWLIREAHGRPWPAVMSLGLSVFFTVHVITFIKRKAQDRPLLTALIAMAGASAVWTLPLVLEKETLTIAFSLVALMFLWLSFKMKSNFLRNLAYVVYLVVFVRLMSLDMPRNFASRVSVDDGMGVYWKMMIERLWTFGSSILSIALAFLLQRGKVRTSETLLVESRNDVPDLVNVGFANQALYWFGILFVFIFMHFEFSNMFMFWQPFRMPALTVLWCVMAAYFLWKFVESDGRSDAGHAGHIMFAAMCVFLFGAIAKVFWYDLNSWSFSMTEMIYDMEYSMLSAGMRLLDFGMLLCLVIGTWFVLSGRKVAVARPIFGYGGLLILFLYASFELNTLLLFAKPDFQAGGISVLWAVFAIVYIIGGIWKNIRPLRFIGLAVFALVIGKVFMVDLSDMEIIYRVIAFLVLGIALMLGSFAYIHSNKKFKSVAGANPGEEA
jgi:hypothetical protein